MCSWPVFLGLLALVVNSPPRGCFAFNVETKHYTLHHIEDRQSMFGFAVAQHRDEQGRGWAIVGAPEANTPNKGYYRGGVVFRCETAVDDRCLPIEFDTKGISYVNITHKQITTQYQLDNKTLQWFGATVSTSKVDGGPILACAPRYVWATRPRVVGEEYIFPNKREPVGSCWLNSSYKTSVEYAPCRTRNIGYNRQGSCQAGLGAALSKDGKRLFIGAPGSWYWQGQMYSIQDGEKLTNYILSDGQLFSQGADGRARILFTKEGPASLDDSYMGYSVSTGDYEGTGDNGVAVGIPRGDELHGKVMLMTSDMKNHYNVSGEQVGAYFGYSVAAGDIDGDGFEDLIVGAPMYTIPNNLEMTIETGRVYVYYQSSKSFGKYERKDTRDGEFNRGRFGLSVSSVGDIDRDGFGDIAVGAPYAGPEGRGVVYIYHGSSTGILETYSQRIFAEELKVESLSVKTFGFSLAGSLDLDNNGYPDLLVGAYESNAAMVFRSRPVIKMDSYVEFGVESKLIALDHPKCLLSNGEYVTCFPLKACLNYTGHGVFPRHEFNVQLALDVKKSRGPRLFFVEFENNSTINYTVTADRDRQFCRNVQVYITPHIRDKLTTLDAEMRMSVKEDYHYTYQPRNPRVRLLPVLGESISRKDSLTILKNCGADNICIPDLHLTMKPNVARYLLGSGNRLEIDVIIENRGEDAFEAIYSLQLPTGIDYIKINRSEKSDILVQCSPPTISNNNTLRCDIGNPFPQGKVIHFVVLLQPVTSHGMKPIYEFDMDVNTTNPEDPLNVHDNKRHLSLPIWIETELFIEGESKPKDWVPYNPNNYTGDNITHELDIGPAFSHNYTIRNQGPSDILEAEAFFIWPALTLGGDDLVYLLEQPETSGNGIQCNVANANPMGVKLEQRRRQYVQHKTQPSGGVSHTFDNGINVQSGGSGITESEEKMEIENEDDFGDSSYALDRRRNKTHSSSSSSSTSSSSVSSSSTVIKGTSNVIVNNEGGKSEVFLTPRPPDFGETTSSVEGGHGGTIHFGHEASAGRNSHASVNVHGSSDVRVTSSWGDNENRTWQNSYDSRKDLEGEREKEERRFFELQRMQEREEARRRLEEEREQQRRRQEDETRRAEERRLYEEKLRQIALKRRQEEEEESRHRASSFDERFSSSSNHSGTSGQDFSFHLTNVTSAEGLSSFFRTLTRDASQFEVFSRQGKQVVQFQARFKTTGDRKEYIEFENGSKFPLLDRHGGQSYAPETGYSGQATHLLRMEGELVSGPNGKSCIRLKDGRMFPLESSYTYTEERTYTLGNNGWETSSPGENENEDEEYYYEEEGDEEGGSYDEKDYKSSEAHGKATTSSMYREDADFQRKDSSFRSPRYRRESDVLTVQEFRKLQAKRARRELETGPFLQSSDLQNIQLPSCDVARCVTLKCTLGPLAKDQEVWIGARFRVNARTLMKVAYNEKVRVSTQLVTRVTKQPFIGTPNQPIVKTNEIYTNIEPVAPSTPSNIPPLWVVVLSACAGAIILLLLIYLLHKCGFFKRNRPSDAPERQPLNRNGHFQQND